MSDTAREVPLVLCVCRVACDSAIVQPKGAIGASRPFPQSLLAAEGMPHRSQ